MTSCFQDWLLSAPPDKPLLNVWLGSKSEQAPVRMFIPAPAQVENHEEENKKKSRLHFYPGPVCLALGAVPGRSHRGDHHPVPGEHRGRGGGGH